MGVSVWRILARYNRSCWRDLLHPRPLPIIMATTPPPFDPVFDLYANQQGRIRASNIVFIILPTIFVILRLISRKISRAGYWVWWPCTTTQEPHTNMDWLGTVGWPLDCVCIGELLFGPYSQLIYGRLTITPVAVLCTAHHQHRMLVTIFTHPSPAFWLFDSSLQWAWSAHIPLTPWRYWIIFQKPMGLRNLLDSCHLLQQTLYVRTHH